MGPNVEVSGYIFKKVYIQYTHAVSLLTIQSETWLVHAKVRKPHLDPRFV